MRKKYTVTIACSIAILLLIAAYLLAISRKHSSSLLQQTQVSNASLRQIAACLPKNIDTSSPYSYAGMKVKMTLGQELQTIGAHCNAFNDLVDKTNRKIDIEQPVGCSGNQQADSPEILIQKSKRIQELKKIYDVIIPQCNPGIM